MLKRMAGAASAALLASAVGCSSPPVADEAQGESQDHLLAGRHLSQGETAQLLRSAGFPESSIGKMVCTAKYESSFYERASNHNSNGSSDYGLFQINSVHLRSAGCPSTSAGLYDAAANTKCALTVYRSQGVNAWYGYKKHKSECDRFPAPASTGTTVPDPSAVTTASSSGSTSNGSSSGSTSSGSTSSGSTSSGSTSSTSSGGSTSSSGSPDPADDGTGGCYSATLQDIVDAGTCVESAYGNVWMQCHDGLWYRGVNGKNGPFGVCTAQYPL